MLESFDTFLRRYQEACSRFDTEAVMASVAGDYQGDYRYPGGMRRSYDRAGLMEGWTASAEYLGAGGARLVFENVATMAREEERIVASWVTMPVPKGPPGHSFLVAAFAPREGAWMLVREVMEHRVDPDRGDSP